MKSEEIPESVIAIKVENSPSDWSMHLVPPSHHQEQILLTERFHWHPIREDGGIVFHIQMDGVGPNERNRYSVSNINLTEGEFRHLVLHGVGLGICPGEGFQYSISA